jgi:hypothetical protein
LGESYLQTQNIKEAEQTLEEAIKAFERNTTRKDEAATAQTLHLLAKLYHVKQNALYAEGWLLVAVGY